MQFRLSSIYVCQSSIRPHWGVQSVKSLVDWKPPSDFLKVQRNLIWIKWQTTTARGTNAPNSAWPDVDIKSSPSRPNSSHSSFDVKIPFFIKAAKIVKYLGYFCTKNCHQSPYKIFQSGHTGMHIGVEIFEENKLKTKSLLHNLGLFKRFWRKIF